MAISSVGYEGTVDYPDYGVPLVVPAMYTLRGDSASGEAGAFRPSRVTGGADRTVRVAGGTAVGYGITDTESDAYVHVQLEPVSSGSRWDEIVLRRDWSEKKTTLTVIQGGSSGPPDLPIRNKQPGILDDQPIAYARVQAGEQYVTEVIDLRCWASDGGLVAVDELALSYLQNHIGTRVTIGDTTYTRVVSPGGAVSWKADRPEETGVITPQSPWSVNLRWVKYGSRVTIIGRPIRQMGSGNITWDNGYSRLYNLPSGLRPEVDRFTTALSPRIRVGSDRSEGYVFSRRGLFSVTVEKSGGVFVFNTDPDWDIVEGTSYHFDLTYYTQN